MDRHLISPGPDGLWHVSEVFDKRRSSAESDLVSLQGTDIILPHDEAFYPSEKALKWRYEQLLTSSPIASLPTARILRN